MARGRKPKTGPVSEVHYYIPKDIQEYLCRMGPSSPHEKITSLIRQAVTDNELLTLPEIKGKLIGLNRQHRKIGDAIRACKSRFVELGLTMDQIEEIDDEIAAMLKEESD